MKTSLLPVIVGASFFALPQMAPAALLVGYSDFGFTSNVDTSPNEVLTGFSGSISKSALVTDISVTGGSSDGFYGPDTVGGGGVAIGGLTPVLGNTNNGRIGGVTGVTFTVTNVSSPAYSLTSLLFDGRRNGEAAPTRYTVAWSSPGGSGSYGGPGLLEAVSGGGAPVTTPYDDFIVNLGGIVLGLGQSIVFSFTATDATSRLDNIALTGELSAIPEPGSLLALGALVGSGAFLRSRRRTPMALA